MSNKKSKKITKLNKRGRPRKSCRNTKLKKSCTRHSRCSWRKGTGCVRKPSKRKSTKNSKTRKYRYGYQFTTRDELKDAVEAYYYEGDRSYGPIGTWDTSCVKDMSFMFNGLRNFNEDISSWDTSNVENMSNMFASASSFNNGDPRGKSNKPLNTHTVTRPDGTKYEAWNVSKVKNMYGMFQSARYFNQDISNWNVSKVENMSHMFYTAINFNQDLSSWDVSNVKNTTMMFSMAYWMMRKLPDLAIRNPPGTPDVNDWKNDMTPQKTKDKIRFIRNLIKSQQFEGNFENVFQNPAIKEAFLNYLDS